jgi:hypothetical protein
MTYTKIVFENIIKIKLFVNSKNDAITKNKLKSKLLNFLLNCRNNFMTKKLRIKNSKGIHKFLIK